MEKSHIDEISLVLFCGSDHFLYPSFIELLDVALLNSFFKFCQVESYNTERALRKIKRHSSSPALDVSEPCAKWETRKKSVDQKGVDDLSGHHMERLKLTSEESGVCQINDMECESQLSEQVGTNKKDGHARSFIGWPSSWYKSFYNKTLKSCLKCLFFISSFA